MAIYWVGLETTNFPHGHGEDYREYVTIEDGEDKDKKLHEAVLRWATNITSWQDGSRIAVRLVDRSTTVLLYDLNSCPNVTPEYILSELGIVWEKWEVQPIVDQIKLSGCKNVPDELPPYIRRAI